MNSLIISLNAVFPVFALILLGLFLRRIRLISDATTAQLNKLVFYVFMPVLLFTNVYNTDAESVFHPWLLIYCLSGVALLWIVVSFIVCGTVKSMKVRGAAIQGISRSNFILFGIPIVAHMVSGRSFGVISLVAAFAVPVLNLLSVITLEIFRRERIHLGIILKGIARNPLIIGSLLGVIVLLIGIELPDMINNTLHTMSGMASPLGLIVMGAALEFDKIRGNKMILTFSVIAKLILIPAVAVSIAVLLGFRSIDLLTITVLFAAPTAISSYPMAVEMESDHDLACQIVVFTTMFACFTNFVFIFVLSSNGLI